MTKKEAIKKVLDIAKSYIGYLEKASKQDLDDPKANIGKGNFTKFARDFFPELQGLEWCCMFVYSCFAYAFNPIMAQNILSGTKTAKCSVLQNAMMKNNKIVKTPEEGDLVFFQNKNGSICHIGIISNVSGNRIETIEGNTSAGNNVVVESGGGVYRKYYDLSNARIHSFGRPTWDYVSKQESQNEDKKLGTAHINATDVNIRSGPGLNYEKLFQVKKGYLIKIVSEAKDTSGNVWYCFEEDGAKRYVRSDLVSF